VGSTRSLSRRLSSPRPRRFYESKLPPIDLRHGIDNNGGTVKPWPKNHRAARLIFQTKTRPENCVTRVTVARRNFHQTKGNADGRK
jgi:hypothetical protein